MLGKLLKHEWNATARKYGLFYLILAAVTLFAGIVHAIPTDNMFFGFGEVAVLAIYIITLCAVFFCSTGMAVLRFYKNMVSDEGYLTFTLPAKVEQLVFAKLLVAFVWQLVTIVLVVASLYCVFVLGHISMAEIFEVLGAELGSFKDVLIVFGLMIPVSLVYQLLVYYLSIAIGQLYGEHKIVGAVLAYCVLNFVIEMLIFVIMLAVLGIGGFIDMSVSMSTMDGMASFYLLMTGLSALIAVGAYFATCQVLKKKLNLS